MLSLTNGNGAQFNIGSVHGTGDGIGMAIDNQLQHNMATGIGPKKRGRNDHDLPRLPGHFGNDNPASPPPMKRARHQNQRINNENGDPFSLLMAAVMLECCCCFVCYLLFFIFYFVFLLVL